MIIVVMGACGCGKSTTGKGLADKLNWQFADADDFHSESSKKKMASGIALNDDDRLPWLQGLHLLIVQWQMEQQDGVIACSALKRTYRNILRHGRPDAKTVFQPLDLQFAYLQGSYDLLESYLIKRSGHFMKSSMLKAQLDTLEEPVQEEEDCVTVDASLSQEIVVMDIIKRCKAEMKS